MSDAESIVTVDFFVIGGSHDGEVITLPEDAFQRHKYLSIPCVGPNHDIQFPKNADEPSAERYRLGIIIYPCGENQFPVLIIDSMPYERAIAIFMGHMDRFARRCISNAEGLHAYLIASGQRIELN